MSDDQQVDITKERKKKKATVQEEEPVVPENQEPELFDASKKKKKKKKVDEGNTPTSGEFGDVADELANTPASDELGDLSLPKKKKKKKKQQVENLEEGEELPLEEEEEAQQLPDDEDALLKKKKKKKKQQQIDEQDNEEPVTPDVGGDDLAMKKKKKKKKKTPTSLEEELATDDMAAAAQEAGDSGEGADAPIIDLGAEKSQQGDVSTGAGAELGANRLQESELGPENWIKSDRDYEYSELLDRVIAQLKKKNPELGAGKKKKIRMRPPQVARDGPKKTVFLNFEEICTNLHRHQDHVLHYMMSELGTTGNLDSSNRLIMRSVFQGKQIESVLRKYISEYVLCQDCGSLETRLTRDANTRLYSLNCMNCGASHTVQTVKQGFVANFTPRRHRQ